MVQRKAVIVGGSLGGLFAGVLLREAGFDVTIAERSRQGLDGRGAGLVGQREIFAILRAVGCEHVAQIGVVARERITLDRAGRVIDRVAAPQMQLSWDRMYGAFRERFPDERYQLGRTATAAVDRGDAVEVRFADGSAETADLVVGADGVGSVVRAAVAPDTAPSYAGYAAWRGLFPEAELPATAADLLSERFAFFHYPSSHILGYLVPGPDGATGPGHRRYNWVWYRPAAAGAELDAALTDASGHRHAYSLPPGGMTPAALETQRREADAELPAVFAMAVRAEPRPFVQAIFDYAAPRMARGRIALLGDAAFMVRPHTAMGVAKAAGDAMALRERFAGAADIASALAAFDAERRPTGVAIAAHGRRLGAALGRSRAEASP